MVGRLQVSLACGVHEHVGRLDSPARIWSVSGWMPTGLSLGTDFGSRDLRFHVLVTGNSSMATPKTTVFHLPNRIDTWTIQQVEESFFVQQFDPGVHVILDMSNVTFMSSSGIRFLLVASDRLRKNGGGDILLVALQKSVYDILAVCNLDKRLQIFETLEAAQKHLGMP